MASTRMLRRFSISLRCYATSTEYEAARPYNEIPGPKPWPIIGNVHRFIPGIGKLDMTEFSKAMGYLHKTFGDIVRVTGLPRKDMVLIFNPTDIEKMFRTEGIWPSRPQMESFVHYRKVIRKDFFEGIGGVLVDQGKEWHEARSQVNPIMMQPRAVKRYTETIGSVADDFVAKFPILRDNKGQLPDSFKNELHKWALESIALVALDTRLGCLAPNLAPDSEPQIMINCVHDALACMQKLDMGGSMFYKTLPSPTFKRFVTCMDTIREISMKHVQRALKRYAEKGQQDESVLALFMARDPNPKRAVVMVLDMLAAGIDTTSHAVTSVLLHLANSQDKQEKLYQELKTLLPNPNDQLTDAALDEMRYLKACFKESLRLQTPTVGNARTTQEEIVLCNFRIPKNVDILMPNAYLSTMESHFSRAMEYLPERWLRGNENYSELSGMKSPFVSLPFGHGARKCVGMRFAVLEAEVLLAKIIRRYRLEWHNPPMKFKNFILNIPVDPLRFTVIDREL
ncbi:hypothetical protein B566_EDAN006200 [Ephemera danica]|nr:hypothetical protein B566_EDAN006200 [Ephemera danica]